MNDRRATATKVAPQQQDLGSLPQEPGAANLAKRPEDTLADHTYHTAEVINDKLREAEQNCHLVAPATRVGSLPPGCGVAFSVIYVDPTVDSYGSGPDVFKVDGGKLSLHKHVFDRIASGLGVMWNPRESRRTDDGTDPHYCTYKAVGVYRSFDMGYIVVQDEYELDLRDGSERVEELLEKGEAQLYGNETREEKRAKAKKSLRQMRKFILQRAVTGARTRAVGNTGLKRSYTPTECALPFVIAKLHFDGHSDDPQTRRMFAKETARAFLPSVGALFGDMHTTTGPVLPEDLSVPDDADDDADGAVAATPPAPSAQPAKPAAPAQPPRVIVLPDPNNTPIATADTGLLQRWQRRITDDMTDGMYPAEELDEYKQLLLDIAAELKKRAGTQEKY